MSQGTVLGQSPIIDSLDASKITGTLSPSQIPNLNANKITSGILPVDRGGTGVSSLDALSSKIGAGCGFKEIYRIVGQNFSNGQNVSIPLNRVFREFGNFYIYLYCRPNGGPTRTTTSILAYSTNIATVTNTSTSSNDYARYYYCLIDNFLIRISIDFSSSNTYINYITELPENALSVENLTLSPNSDVQGNIFVSCTIFAR